ncbi:hypothetical protein [Tropicimonas isoalkanivorans]|uniref:Methyltransferase n=1 Tax=Tropicimonas isoalkanivorans TaxID=441112 RepID=A0A1I1PJU9_9RHOB|nr:hypothetical protein [Tropicimonas isoalkanivorans]SFD09927.1 hypothetical protein SAMN04488094_11558 [Tropicimonas isoalkanivorans]
MLKPQERRIQGWFKAIWVKCAGDVMDLGRFAGGATARLAEGMAVAGSTRQVHAYDRYSEPLGSHAIRQL